VDARLVCDFFVAISGDVLHKRAKAIAGLTNKTRFGQLRDQLIAAGFEAPKKPVKKTAKKTQAKKRRPNAQGRNASGKKEATTGASKAAGRASKKDVEAEAEILKRKKQKAEIKELIDNNKLENWKGEVAYRYTVEKRIRELYVNEPAHKELAARAVAITRP